MPMLLPPEVTPDRKPLVVGIFVAVFAAIIIAFTIWYLNVYVKQNVAQQQAQSIQTQLLAPVNNTGAEAVKADVQSSVIAVQNYIGVNGVPTNYSMIPLTKSTDKESLQITGTPTGFTITGTWLPSGFTYTYDSTTGTYR